MVRAKGHLVKKQDADRARRHTEQRGINMKMSEIKELRYDDEVYWEDPDNGLASRAVQIASIDIKGDVVCILEKDGHYLECFAHELR